MADLFRTIIFGLKEYARDNSLAESELATTAGVVLVDSGRIKIGQIGDRIITLHPKDGPFFLPSLEIKVEYAHETTFVTAPDALSLLRVDHAEEADLDALVLSTDGLRYKILANATKNDVRPYEPFFTDIVRYVAEHPDCSQDLAQFLTDLDDQTGDDKSLVVAVRQGRTCT